MRALSRNVHQFGGSRNTEGSRPLALYGELRKFSPRPLTFDRLRSLGFNICLGTDSLASSETLSLFDEMRAFQKNFPQVSPKEILQMVTVNPARALRQENSLGQIRPDFAADLIAVPCSTSADIFEKIVAFDGAVHLVFARNAEGQIL